MDYISLIYFTTHFQSFPLLMYIPFTPTASNSMVCYISNPAQLQTISQKVRGFVFLFSKFTWSFDAITEIYGEVINDVQHEGEVFNIVHVDLIRVGGNRPQLILISILHSYNSKTKKSYLCSSFHFITSEWLVSIKTSPCLKSWIVNENSQLTRLAHSFCGYKSSTNLQLLRVSLALQKYKKCKNVNKELW